MRSLVAGFLVLFTLAGCVGPRHDAPAAGALRILLTNDDGYDSPGIVAMRDALVGAGHRVTVVAPLENRSGSSSSSTTAGTLELVEQRPGVWSVSGTPADAVRVGLDVVWVGPGPDLIVSGANFGQNIGPSTLQSGTVGAALTAMGRGYPAIAISVGINPSEMRSEPRFASTLAAFDDAGRFLARVVGALSASRGANGGLLPEHTVLNINYPAREASEITGVAWARIGRGSHFDFGYERAGSDRVRIVFGGGASRETIEEADTTLFDAGNVTLTLLDGDLIAPPNETQRVREPLHGVNP
jgi:5'-nucleotidase